MASEKSLEGNAHLSEAIDIEKGLVDTRSQHSTTDEEFDAVLDAPSQIQPINRVSTAATAKSLERFETLQPITTARDWNGINDPLNPHNWSGRKKAWHTLQPALFAFAVFVTNLSDFL